MDSEATETCGLNDLHFVHNRRLVVGSVAHVVISYGALARFSLCSSSLLDSEFYGSSQKLGMENEDEMWRGLEISL